MFHWRVIINHGKKLAGLSQTLFRFHLAIVKIRNSFLVSLNCTRQDIEIWSLKTIFRANLKAFKLKWLRDAWFGNFNKRLVCFQNLNCFLQTIKLRVCHVARFPLFFKPTPPSSPPPRPRFSSLSTPFTSSFLFGFYFKYNKISLSVEICQLCFSFFFRSKS